MTLQPRSIPGLFLRAVEDHGPSVAIRRKRLGIWKEITWNDYRDCVQALYHGLRGLGVQKGDVVCIVSTNRPEWLYTDIACQCIGALPLGVYPDCPDGELESLIIRNGARFAILEDQEQTDKILRSIDRLTALEKCIVIDWKGMEGYDHARLTSYAGAEKTGRQSAHEHPDDLKRDVARLDPKDPAFLSLTSGTGGEPKTVVLTHEAVLGAAESFMKIQRFRADDELVSCIPLAWIAERCFSVVFHTKSGYRVSFPESTQPDVLSENMREIAPSVMNCTAGLWERLCFSVHSREQNASWLKQRAFRAFMPIAARMAGYSYRGNGVPFGLALLNLLGDFLLHRKIRERLGLRLLRCAYTGGSSMGPEVYSFYHMIGIDIRQLYTLTEIGGPCAGQYPGEPNPETSGRAFPDVEIRLSESDEILLRAPCFAGYYDNPTLAAEAYKEGWLSTGDRGRIDDKGQLNVLGRHADMIETAEGVRVQPDLIENALKSSPYVKRAVAVGQRRPLIGALVQIDRESVGSWAQRKGIPYTTFQDLATKPEVIDLIGQEVEKVNRKLDRTSCVAHYTLLEKELEPDDGELTRTGRPRRRLIESKYGNLIDSMYAGRRGSE